MTRVTKADLEARIVQLEGLERDYINMRDLATRQSQSLKNAEQEVTRLILIIQSQAKALESMAAKTGSDY